MNSVYLQISQTGYLLLEKEHSNEDFCNVVYFSSYKLLKSLH